MYPALFPSATQSNTASSANTYAASVSTDDARTKNARAQARHRAKRKAYVEQLEAAVHSLRVALNQNGVSTPAAAAKIQLLEQENARLRREFQSLRARLQSGYSSSHSSNTASASDPGSFYADPSYPSSIVQSISPNSSSRNHDLTPVTAPLQQPSATPRSSAEFDLSNVYTATPEDRLSGRYYDSGANYRRQPSPPFYTLARREASLESERNSNSHSRSSTRSHVETKEENSPSLQDTSYVYSTSQMLSGMQPAYPPASQTATSYIIGARYS